VVRGGASGAGEGNAGGAYGDGYAGGGCGAVCYLRLSHLLEDKASDESTVNERRIGKGFGKKMPYHARGNIPTFD
jgi:hypothetical protein